MAAPKGRTEGHPVFRIAEIGDGSKFPQGAFAWKMGGNQWVPVLPKHDGRPIVHAVPLGKARVYEDGDGVYAELRFDLGNEVVRKWHRKAGRDPEKMWAELDCSFWYVPVDGKKTAQGWHGFKHVDVMAVGISVGSAAASWPAKPQPKPDPAWSTIAEAMDAVADFDDGKVR